MKSTLCIIVLHFLLLPAVVNAQELFNYRNNINHITMGNGLLSDFIDHVYKDSRGFLWVATSGGGLSRYDGYRFVHYNINTSETRLSSNFIVCCCEDAFGRLWITSEEGIDLLDLSTDRIVTLHDTAGEIHPIFRQPAANILKDSQDNIWVYSNNVVKKITFDQKGNIAKEYAFSSARTTFPTIAMNDLDGDGNIWVGMGNKIYKLHTAENEIYPVSVSPLLELPGYARVFCAKENEIWIGTEVGLVRYYRNGEVIKKYWSDNSPTSLTQNYITDIVVNSEKQLLVSTLKGLNIYNPATDDFEQVVLDSENPAKSLSSNFINCMMVNGDITWIGTESGGLNKITPKDLSVRSYRHSKYNPGSLSPNPVNAIYEDENETLWVGTIEGGLNRKDKESEEFIHYTTENSGLVHNSVTAITKDNRQQLWIGTWGSGVTVFDSGHSDLPAKKYISNFPTYFIGALCYDSINDLMWLGTDWGIYYYDYKTDQLYSPFEETDIAQKIHRSRSAVIDSCGQLWVGCSWGLFIFDLNTPKEGKFSYKHLRYKLDDPDSRLGERISSIKIDSNNVLWLGSDGNGLFKHIPKEDGSVGTFINYNTSHGLISNTVYGILEDQDKQLWLSTNNGLSCFNPVVDNFRNYNKNEGLDESQFYWNAYSQSKSGLLYFGGINGLIAVNPTKRNARHLNSKVTLTRLHVMNETIRPDETYIDTDISVAKKIRLHEKDKGFSLEFAALNFDSPATATYSYRLLGFDDKWIQVPANHRFAGFTNLPAGEYIFQVKYSADSVNADSPVTEVQILVAPFFYKTKWFIALMLILTISITVYIYFRRIYTLEKQKQLLHQTVEERTQELKQQNELLIQMSNQVQELTTDKISFFTNITHEFRTPITLIIGPIERALKLSVNPKVIEQLNFVERNSKYLLSLVNQLMDFRKIESGKMEIVKMKGDFIKFVSTVLTPFEAFASERNITLRLFTRISCPDFVFAQDAMQKVITNLISNALKFTPDGGTVSLYVATLKENSGSCENEKLYIAVRDTGIGILEGDLSKIFDRFYQSKADMKYSVYGQSGTGIGLYLCQKIIRQMEGTIYAVNNKVRGSSFRVLLPLEYNGIEPIRGEIAVKEEKESSSDFVPGKLTILVVEDNKDMRSFIRSILTDYYNVLEAGNGQEALSLLAQNNVDFIISDLMMPIMDGLELSRRVKENFTISHIPILMLTAKTSPEARIESYKTGVDSYLSKPFSEELLLSRINNIFEIRKRYHNLFVNNNMDVTELHMEEESRDRKFINKAIEVLQANYKNSSYHINDFAKDIGVSKNLLNDKLQTLTGQSTKSFLRNYRLNIARELIERNKTTRNLNISEIAYEVGFNDPKYFSRCFSKRFNMLPSSIMETEGDNSL